MSYIYEALKRAEADNARDVAAARPASRPLSFSARGRWWLWGFIAALAVNAIVLVTLFLGRSSNSQVVRPPAPAPVPTGVTASPPSAEVSGRKMPVPRVAVAPPPPRSGRPAPPAPSIIRADPSPVSTTGVVAGSVPETPPTPALTPGALSSAPVPPVTPPPAPAAPAAATTPAVIEAPKLQVQVVVYSNVPAQRMVFIDGRRYAEGDILDDETVVERITPDGAVVRHRGQRFALTSGRP